MITLASDSDTLQTSDLPYAYTIPAGIKLIGICGHAGAGKDTVADYINSAFQDCWVEPFASPLKEAASQAFGVELTHFYDPELKETELGYWGVTPRMIAQFFGTELFRNSIQSLLPEIGNDFWVARLAGKLSGSAKLETEGEYTAGDTVVIPDLRFQNEYDFVISNGGLVIHLVRDGADGAVGISGHASENLSSLNFHTQENSFYVANNSTIEDLQEQVRHVLQVSKLTFIQKFTPPPAQSGGKLSAILSNL